jgi:hypothetical protein
VPEDPSCTRHCSGLRAVFAAYQNYRESTEAEDVQPLTVFHRDHFKPNTFTSKFLEARGLEALGL